MIAYDMYSKPLGVQVPGTVTNMSVASLASQFGCITAEEGITLSDLNELLQQSTETVESSCEDPLYADFGLGQRLNCCAVIGSKSNLERLTLRLTSYDIV